MSRTLKSSLEKCPKETTCFGQNSYTTSDVQEVALPKFVLLLTRLTATSYSSQYSYGNYSGRRLV